MFAFNSHMSSYYVDTIRPSDAYVSVNYAINDSGNSLLPVRHWAFKPLSEPIFIVNWILQNEFQWYFNENSSIFIDKNEFEMSSANPRSARRYHEIPSTHWMTDDVWPIKSIPIHRFIWGRHLKYKSVFMAMNILVLIETLVIMRYFPTNVPSVWWIPQRDRTEYQ